MSRVGYWHRFFRLSGDDAPRTSAKDSRLEELTRGAADLVGKLVGFDIPATCDRSAFGGLVDF